MKKVMMVLPLSAVALTLVLSGCTPGVNGNENDKRETKTFSRGSDGKSGNVLPSWVPDDATDIREVIRTTGSERILAMRNAPVPASCTPVPAGQSPRSGDDKDSSWKADEFVTTGPTLTADWWPTGIEQQATAVCGKWWVTVQDGTTYAYSPERKVMMDRIKK